MDSNGFPIATFTRWSNIWYRRAAVWVWKHADDWRFDDTAGVGSGDQDDDAGLPVALSTLVSSQKIYALPTTALRVRRVEVKDNAGLWHRVLPIREQSIKGAKAEYRKIDGRPVEYLLVGNKIQLLPAPDNGVTVTLVGGMRVYFDRDVDSFVVGDTSAEPSLPVPWHQLLSLGPAFDFAVANGLANADALEKQILTQYPEMAEFVSGRQTDTKDTLVMRPRRFNSM